MKKLIIAITVIVGTFIASPAFAYTVQSGDTMTKIARENQITLQELSKLNPQIQNLDLINVGQTINTDKPEMKVGNSEYEKDLLARLVRAEANGESFEGKIAVACVVLNRIESPAFPDTIRDVVYQPGQFSPVRNGEINKPADEESIKAVAAALTENRNMAGGSLFFYNPAIAESHWLDSRSTTMVIGHHVFKR
jgi:N-acetylmuramoyl-L-alanine amidase